jgi:hypothetical protein
MLISEGGLGQTVEDVLRSLGAVLDERHAQGVVLIEVPEGLVVRARVIPSLDDRIDGSTVSIEQAFEHKQLLEQRMIAMAKRGTGHRAGPLERALRVLGRYIDVNDLSGITLMEHGASRGWLLWHRSRTLGRQILITFDHEEVERAARAAQVAREGVPVPVDAGPVELPAFLRA